MSDLVTTPSALPSPSATRSNPISRSDNARAATLRGAPGATVTSRAEIIGKREATRIAQTSQQAATGAPGLAGGLFDRGCGRDDDVRDFSRFRQHGYVARRPRHRRAP